MRFELWTVAAMLLAAPCAAAGEAGPVKTIAHFRNFEDSKGTGRPDGWTTWTPRPEIAPRFSVSPGRGHGGKGALAIDGNGSAAAIGSWRRRVEGIIPGRTYRFVAFYQAEGVPHERRSIVARLDWRDAKDRQARPPDYALDGAKEDGWTRVEHAAQAPEGARSVVIELSLAWSPKGRVRWDDIQLLEGDPARERVVRALTVFHRPRSTRSAAESVEQFCKLVEAAAPRKPDLVCLPEGITVVGTGRSYLEVSEPVPGPTTRRLGEVAKKLGTYIVAGIYERSGAQVYNTAVLIDRKGELAGTYRKTHLPREESEGGITPGDSYPVFDTDFGRVGLMICWDLQFPEPARAMALQGAEVILLPIWGGSDILARARAIENHCFLITSSYDMKTFVVDPAGAVLAEATAAQPVASADLHLDRKIVQPWLGDMKVRTWKERRPDIAVGPAGQ
jgi:predicted amidohydrolase